MNQLIKNIKLINSILEATLVITTKNREDRLVIERLKKENIKGIWRVTHEQ